MPDDVKSMGVGILALCMSLFGKLTRFYSDWQPAHLSFFLYTMGLMYFVAYADSSKGTLNLLRPKKGYVSDFTSN